MPRAVTTAYRLSLFSLRVEPQRKKLCKKEMAIQGLRALDRANTRGAPAFEKAGQNNRVKRVLIPR